MTQQEIVNLCIFIGIILLIFICLIIYRFFLKQVKNHSVLLEQTVKLNGSYKFNFDINKVYKYIKECNSKPKFDRLDLSIYFLGIIENELMNYEFIISKLQSNQIQYQKYQQDYKKLSSHITKEESRKYKVPFFIFKHIEKRYYKKYKLFPPQETSVCIEGKYQSPQGRNSYSKEYTFSYSEIQSYIAQVHKIKEKKETKTYQRALMSDTLRYDILLRDNFTCKICGETRKDGAKLHVDHIIPISKGGKTEIGNLRTLCDRCNLGKKDKIEKPTIIV